LLERFDWKRRPRVQAILRDFGIGFAGFVSAARTDTKVFSAILVL
jgi:hypothetical protein